MAAVVYDGIHLVNGCQMPLQVVLGAEAFVAIAAGLFAVMRLRMLLPMLTARK